MKNDYRGFNLFNDIDNVQVRAWNRCSMFFNIFRDHGREMADNYCRAIDDIGRAHMNKLLNRMKEEGHGNVQKEIQGAL